MTEHTIKLKQIRKLEKEQDALIKPFWLMLPQKEQLKFIQAINKYAEITFKIEELIKYG